MTNSVGLILVSLGNKPAEFLAFKTEEQIETALIHLMAEVFKMKPFLLNEVIEEE